MTQRNALLSVFDKTGVPELARELVELGWTLYSSTGTFRAIAEAGLPVTDVAELTGVPAILGHRVVTLHPKVHGGILGVLNDPTHQADMEEHGIEPFGLVVVNLYPFASDPKIEMIDVGGPTMVRGAAKNHAYVGVVTDPADYDVVLAELRADGELSDVTRKQLAVKAFAHTAAYDQAIVEWISDGEYEGVLGRKVEDLKYGENPWMKPAALYQTDDGPLSVPRFELVEGDQRSLVGLTDVDCLLQVLTHLAAGHELNFGSVPLMAVGVKHGNPCGAAVGSDPVDVVKRMVAGDKQALFGAVVMTNFPITRGVAAALMERESTDPPRLFDGVYAPWFDADAPEVLKRYQGKCRMMANPALADLTINSLDTSPRRREVRGGYLLQPNYTFVLDLRKTERREKAPSEKEWEELIGTTINYGPLGSSLQKYDLVTAWAVGSVSNSNTITIVAEGTLLGNGVGQQDRVGAAELAIKRAKDAGHDLGGASAWSDSFFPAPDGPQVLARAGIRTLFASSGSKRDQETIDTCIAHKVALLMQPDSEVRGFAKH